MKRDILSLKDLTKEEIWRLIRRALEIKREGKRFVDTLKGRTLGLLFEKASTRTRISFEVAMFRMGGNTLFIKSQDTQLSRNESLMDTARVLSGYLDCLAVRTYSQEFVEEMARWSKIPIINALTDKFHPCQILSDLLTIIEKKGDLTDLKISWVGDGNNVANSWIEASKILGFQLVVACPRGYEPDPDIMEMLPPNMVITHDPKEAARDADVLNTDVWVSMGQENDRDKKLKAFLGYSVTEELLSLSKKDAIVLHCLPAHRGEEITDGVMDGPNSVVFLQAENKLYMHQAILEWLIQ